MEAWDGGWGACAGGPPHPLLLLQAIQRAKEGKKIAGEKKKRPFSMRESSIFQEAGLWQDLALQEWGGPYWSRDKSLP